MEELILRIRPIAVTDAHCLAVIDVVGDGSLLLRQLAPGLTLATST
jgi:hypothetical protein